MSCNFKATTEKLKEILNDIGISNRFMNRTQIVYEIRGSIDKWYCRTFKTSYITENIYQNEATANRMVEIFASYSNNIHVLERDYKIKHQQKNPIINGQIN
jgi:hypothetical protein